MIFVIIYRLVNDNDLLKSLLIGLIGLVTFNSDLELIIRIVVPCITCFWISALSFFKIVAIIKDLKDKKIK